MIITTWQFRMPNPSGPDQAYSIFGVEPVARSRILSSVTTVIVDRTGVEVRLRTPCSKQAQDPSSAARIDDKIPAGTSTWIGH